MLDLANMGADWQRMGDFNVGRLFPALVAYQSKLFAFGSSCTHNLIDIEITVFSVLLKCQNFEKSILLFLLVDVQYM